MIYLDNASTTKLCDSGLENLIKYSVEDYYNPSAIYAVQNSNNIKQAKEEICKKLGVKFENNLIFTASATEANNLAFSVASNNFVISEGEHPSVYNKALQLANSGKDVKFVKLKPNGQIDYEELEKILSADTKFISIMHVSNETGAINDIEKIYNIKSKICPNAIFHCDGVQAFCKINTRLVKYVDLYTISAHKIGGPKGIGALYCKNIKKLKPIIEGGGQEYNLRSGTENLPAIMAFKNTIKNCNNNINYVTTLRNLFLQHIDSGIKCNIQDIDNLSPYILSMQTVGVNGETMVNALASSGIYISTGSACSSKKMGNRILNSIGKTPEEIKQSIRISFFETNTEEEILKATNIINKTYKQLCEKLK